MKQDLIKLSVVFSVLIIFLFALSIYKKSDNADNNNDGQQRIDPILNQSNLTDEEKIQQKISELFSYWDEVNTVSYTLKSVTDRYYLEAEVKIDRKENKAARINTKLESTKVKDIPRELFLDKDMLQVKSISGEYEAIEQNEFSKISTLSDIVSDLEFYLEDTKNSDFISNYRLTTEKDFTRANIKVTDPGSTYEGSEKIFPYELMIEFEGNRILSISMPQQSGLILYEFTGYNEVYEF